MAGRGRAPKHPSQRRNRAQPQRGEWVVLPESHDVKRPPLPKPYPKGGFSEAAKREWESWWSSPVAVMWDESDVGLLSMLVRMIDQWWSKPNASLAKEIRMFKDNLGLTPKGRQDRRWLLPEEDEAGETPKPDAESPWGHLRPVADG